MKHKCFISFKTEDISYKKAIQNDLDVDMIDKSLNEPINSQNEDYIMRKIREDYLKDSTVTICLIGKHSAENDLFENQHYIKRELQASLYDVPNGILGVVLPDMTNQIYKGTYTCEVCGQEHNYVKIDDDTVIKEFSVNYYIPNHSGCAWSADERYCVLVKWEDFVKEPNTYIEAAFDKRSEPVKNKITVFPK
ncbi:MULTISPECIES: TIR domain-containing protein [Limosilactobacillus]|uniref:TIR domain-containing protein n=1 Tax=Limosilactobacillus TaxID=2742598 RepID=UPI000C1B741E|nr:MULTISPECIES: TIR domain-containing protein [Limosilactobacillus]MQB96626.1 molecular chaperone Tir [Limosilactobacillus reuteri]PIN31148.1 molecular chaperone Tir [Limosilactobacillus reuteri]PUH36123.1 molecular chaperone Tir [Limosilactobacillus reuteri]PUH36404.1 molecular chaperone Tir [Limosilactobacillus reuteri]WLC96572.1 TIR domain-containing protein [Limosilactobacillus reuteri]